MPTPADRVASDAATVPDVSPAFSNAELTESEVVQVVQQYGGTPRKLLVLGNSGVGKSALCNVIAGEQIFCHKYQAGSVTTDNSFAVLPVGKKLFVVSNIPGLMEAKKENMERNKAAIEAAVRMLPDSPTVVMFVVSLKGGRPATDDLEAIRLLLDYAHIKPESVVVVVNGVDKEELEPDSDDEADVTHESKFAAFRAEACALIRAVLPQIEAVQIEFTFKLPKNVLKNHESEEVLGMQLQLLGALDAAVPAATEVDEEQGLDLELSAAARELIEKKLAAQKAAFDRDMAERGAAWEARMRSQEDAARLQKDRQEAMFARLRADVAAANARAEQAAQKVSNLEEEEKKRRNENGNGQWGFFTAAVRLAIVLARARYGV